VLQIYDSYGRILRNYSIDPLNFIFSFETEKFENGLFNYRIVDSKGTMIDTGQFIIMK
jgi:hypothetical protein